MHKTKKPLWIAVLIASLFVPMLMHGQGQGSDIMLLEPIGDLDRIPVTGNEGLGVFGTYMGELYPWAIGLAAATAVLMAVAGGLQIIMGGADTAKRDAGKNRLIMALGGLLLLLLSATILNALNPTFFR